MTALVVGVGLTGRSLASHLLELGEEVLAIDSRQSPPMAEKMPPVEIWRGEDFRLWPASRFKQFTRVALSAGCRPPMSPPRWKPLPEMRNFLPSVADA